MNMLKKNNSNMSSWVYSWVFLRQYCYVIIRIIDFKFETKRNFVLDNLINSSEFSLELTL